MTVSSQPWQNLDWFWQELLKFAIYAVKLKKVCWKPFTILARLDSARIACSRLVLSRLCFFVIRSSSTKQYALFKLSRLIINLESLKRAYFCVCRYLKTRATCQFAYVLWEGNSNKKLLFTRKNVYFLIKFCTRYFKFVSSHISQILLYNLHVMTALLTAILILIIIKRENIS